MGIAILIFSSFIALFLYARFKRKAPLPQPDFQVEKEVLLQHVSFYQLLDAAEKVRFEEAVQKFLKKVRITGVETVLADSDKVFVAAAAIIPIFAFNGWEYKNITEVLIYPGTFNKDYQIQGKGRDTLGMVGTGPMENTMILSQADLRNGFMNHTHKSNTAIHEFVHLVDKSDGSIDGVPRALLRKEYVMPWLKRMHEEINLIKAGKSDINPYAITSEAEFLAVAAEYFFEQPHLLQSKHPELFGMLEQMFTPLADNDPK